MNEEKERKKKLEPELVGILLVQCCGCCREGEGERVLWRVVRE
jgi:hypothetical protein